MGSPPFARVRIGLALVAAALLYAACTRPDPPDPGETEPPAGAPADTPGAPAALALPGRDEFLRRGLLPVGDTRAALVETLGEPDSVRSAVVPNRHVPGVQDTLFTVHYPGLTVELHRPGGGRDMLAGVSVRENRYLRYPVIGATLPQVEDAFGAPDRVEDGRYSFACRVCRPVDEPFELIVEGGRVRGVGFEYYVD